MSSPTQPRSLAANSHGFFLSSPSSPCLTALSMVASSKHTGELAGRAKVPALSGQCGGGGWAPSSTPQENAPIAASEDSSSDTSTPPADGAFSAFSASPAGQSELKTLESS